MAYELTGKVKIIQDAQTFGSGFTKREMVVIVEDGKYPQEINLEFVQDKVGLLDTIHVDQEVTVTFDIRGREYEGRYFNNLQGWKLVAGGVAEPAAAAPAAAPADETNPKRDVPADFDEYEDDIPF